MRPPAPTPGTPVRVLRPLPGDQAHREGVVVSTPPALMNGWDVMVAFECSCWADGRRHALGFNSDEIEAL